MFLLLLLIVAIVLFILLKRNLPNPSAKHGQSEVLVEVLQNPLAEVCLNNTYIAKIIIHFLLLIGKKVVKKEIMILGGKIKNEITTLYHNGALNSVTLKASGAWI